MTSQPSGIPDLVAAVRPWRRRVARLVALWLGLVLLSAVLEVAPDVVQLCVIIAAAAAVVWYLIDHAQANYISVWPLTDSSEGTGRRGSDFRATQLAERLADADRHANARAELTKRLHHRLSRIIEERLFAKHGITIEEEPRWAQGVMPPELWDFVTGLPDPALYSPDRLDQILRRIEQW